MRGFEEVRNIKTEPTHASCPAHLPAAKCGRPSPTGLTPNCSQSERHCWWRTATTTRRSSACTPNISLQDRGRRTADPAQHEPLRLPAGRHAVQRGAAAFPRRPLAMEVLRNSVSGAQLVEERLGLLQIERVEAFGEPAVDRRQFVGAT